MSFYGKKYRRAACENVEELLAATKNSEIAYLVKCKPPTICFTKPNEETLTLHLEVEDKNYLASFKFGEEKEMERRDGSKIKMTFTEESENVLKQVVRMPDGKSAFFRREFGDKEGTMTISLPESNVKATIHFERIE